MPALEDDEKRLRCYLLKLGSEDELDRVEERYLATSAYADLITDAEHRLISDYAQERLSEEERRAFEQNYLVTDDRREQLAIARTLAELERAATASAVHSGHDRGLWKRLVDWIAAPGPAVGFAAAAAAVVLVCTNAILFLKWQGQAHRADVANQQIRKLEAGNKNAAQMVAAARVISVPVLAIQQTNLSVAEAPRFVFRLAANAADSVQIPIEVPAAVVEGAIDVTLSASGRSIWSGNDLHLQRADTVIRGSLTIPFATIAPLAGQPLRLDVVERGHAVLGSFELVFNVDR
jgi:hypothetical protein